MSTIGDYIKQERKKAGLTQEEFALRAGDKVNQALRMFGMEAAPGRIRK